MEPVNTLRGTKELLDAIVAKVKAIKLKAGSSEPAFTRAELYSSTNVADAIEELLAASERLATVVYGGERWTREYEGTELTCKRVHDFSVVITDEYIGDSVIALYGDANFPGVLALKDLIPDALTGLLLENPKGVAAAPTGGDSVKIVKSEKDKAPRGRWAYALDFEIFGGELRRDLGRSPIV